MEAAEAFSTKLSHGNETNPRRSCAVAEAIAQRAPWRLRRWIETLEGITHDEREMWNHLLDRCPTLPDGPAQCAFFATRSQIARARAWWKSAPEGPSADRGAREAARC